MTDAKNQTTTRTYDALNRLETWTDSLARLECFTYDGNGNLATVTDRKTQVTTHSYDPTNRRIRTEYADDSSVSFSSSRPSLRSVQGAASRGHSVSRPSRPRQLSALQEWNERRILPAGTKRRALRYCRIWHIIPHTNGMHTRRESMPSKVKVTVSLDGVLVQELNRVGRKAGKSRSRLVEEALEFWRRSRLEQELRRGYQAMAEEDRDTAARSLAAQWEAVR